ncbi:MAG TPA: PadR family transcriptional regulator [Candidatus Limnocylindrales bacterium]|nr:PadR family transcriptional regulator [Candidatus Limnocylindrales bacterium]
MSRTSQTETAVLGALSVMPMTGYAVRDAIRDVLGHFWSESFGQIYPTLSRLEAEGLVARDARDGGAPYRITPEGLARLRALLAEPAQPSVPRNGLLLRLFFGRHLGVEACRGLVADARVAAEAQLAGYTAIRAGIAAGEGTEADRPFWLLTISAGEHAARSTIAWADEAMASLAAIDGSAR